MDDMGKGMFESGDSYGRNTVEKRNYQLSQHFAEGMQKNSVETYKVKRLY